MVSFDSPRSDSYKLSIVSNIVSLTVFEFFGAQVFVTLILDLSRSYKVPVVASFDSPGSVSYRSSFVTNIISLTVFELFEPKYS